MMNVVAFFHAYKFTHFTDSAVAKTGKPEELSFTEKLKALLFGVSNPRPQDKVPLPAGYQTIRIGSKGETEAWYTKKTDSSKGTVVLFHGYAAGKSQMLDKASIFDSLGYNVLLVDFMGSGGSKGNTTTLGYREALQVEAAVDHLQNGGEKNIYLFGTSMGAVAVMKAVSGQLVQPRGIIIECPFGSMYAAVGSRFDNMNAPRFPMAAFLVFWGGVQNGFWAFGHNPVEYADNIYCPTLLLYGEKDKTVSREETDKIFDNLKGEKQLKTYPLAGHENYLLKYAPEWTNDVSAFLHHYE